MATVGDEPCIYCGGSTAGVSRGEHLVPKAIGGTLTTRNVCQTCNNLFSDIDRELCSRSPVSIVAAKEIDGHIWQAWDVDESRGNLLLEGRPDFDRGSFRLFPQIIVDQVGEQLWGNYDELRDFGMDRFAVLFNRRLKKALWEYEHATGKGIHFNRLPRSESLLARYHYLPRFFVRGTVEEACLNKTIELGYASKSARRLALGRVESGIDLRSTGRPAISMGSAFPTVRYTFQADKVWRALAKIAVNILHHSCRATSVNRTNFSRVINEIRGDQTLAPSRLARGGFVRAVNIRSLASGLRSHSARLFWENGRWKAVFAFFGGQIGAVVSFSGPNNETWCTLDVTAPLHSDNWTFIPSSLIIPMRFDVEWDDLDTIIGPSMLGALTVKGL